MIAVLWIWLINVQVVGPAFEMLSPKESDRRIPKVSLRDVAEGKYVDFAITAGLAYWALIYLLIVIAVPLFRG